MSELCEICGQEKVYQTQASEYSDEVMEGCACENIRCGRALITCPICEGDGTVEDFRLGIKQMCIKCLGRGKIWR